MDGSCIKYGSDPKISIYAKFYCVDEFPVVFYFGDDKCSTEYFEARVFFKGNCNTSLEHPTEFFCSFGPTWIIIIYIICFYLIL